MSTYTQVIAHGIAAVVGLGLGAAYVQARAWIRDNTAWSRAARQSQDWPQEPPADPEPWDHDRDVEILCEGMPGCSLPAVWLMCSRKAPNYLEVTKNVCRQCASMRVIYGPLHDLDGIELVPCWADGSHP